MLMRAMRYIRGEEMKQAEELAREEADCENKCPKAQHRMLIRKKTRARGEHRKNEEKRQRSGAPQCESRPMKLERKRRLKYKRETERKEPANR